MYLKSLQLKQFRNFVHLELACHPKFNFIFGKNAQGKTNIIEAIFYLSQLKSFRTQDHQTLIQKDKDFAKLMANFEKDNLTWDIDITLSAKGRQLLLNSKPPQLKKNYFGLMPVVLFEPAHIYLFRGSPGERRRYLDRAVFLQDPTFLHTVVDYTKVVAQKNKFMKQSVHPDLGLLAVWNEKLVQLGAEIIHKRHNWFLEMSLSLKNEYRQISHTQEEFHFEYNSVVALPTTDFLLPLSKQIIAERLQDAIQEKQSLELMRRESLVGPHRDDFKAFLDDRLLGEFGSQGENRSALIALKLAQLKLFAQKYQKTPLFLLDDVASELDQSRCEYLFSYLRDESTQVFLTTTENHIGGADFRGDSLSFLVNQGQVNIL